MASCQTTQWVSTSPYVKLTVTEKSSTATTSTLSWTLQYIASSAANTSVNKSYTVKIAGATVKSGSYNIDGKTGTNTIASGTKTINKTTSSQSISFSVSFAFNLTWSGDYQGTSSASGSISVAAKTKYTITYNANGGRGSVSSQTKWHGTNITLSNGSGLTRTGYTFKGWSTSSTGSVVYAAGATYSTNASDTLYAVWSLITYTVKYNANGGSGAPSSQTKKYGVNLTLSSTKPTRTGYDFKGWATSASGSVAYAAGATYSSNAAVTLYAVWSLKTYKVTYNANGGSGAPSAQTKKYGVNLTLSTTIPTKSGYNFLGWGTSSSATSATYASGATYSSNAAITLYAVWEVAYTKATITGLSVVRCTSDKVASDTGTYAKVAFNWSTYYSISAVSIQWKEVSSTTWTNSKSVTVSGTSGKVTDELIGDGNLATDTSYDVRVIVGDQGGSTILTRTIEGTAFVIDCLAGGKGVAFGKPSELKNTADFGYETRHRGNAIFDNAVGLYGIAPDGQTYVQVMSPQTGSGNLAIGYGLYNAKSGNSTLYGNDVFLGISNIASPGSYRPYRRQGDYINYNIRLDGWVTNSAKELYFFLPFAVPILGSPTVTITSNSGFILRQNGKYTHGSASSTWVTPDSYSCLSSYQYNGLIIQAKFTDVTNATNNDAIGIQWSGRITFEAM